MAEMYRRGSTAYIDGLDDFINDLRAMPGELDKAVVARGKHFAWQVVQRARARASINSQRAKAARTLRVNSSARGVVVSGGGARAKYFWGAEFGGKRMTMGRKLPGGLARGEKKRYGGFDRWTGNQFESAGWTDAPGYFLNPAVNDLTAAEWKAYQEDINRIASQAFPQ